MNITSDMPNASGFNGHNVFIIGKIINSNTYLCDGETVLYTNILASNQYGIYARFA